MASKETKKQIKDAKWAVLEIQWIFVFVIVIITKIDKEFHENCCEEKKYIYKKKPCLWIKGWLISVKPMKVYQWSSLINQEQWNQQFILGA